MLNIPAPDKITQEDWDTAMDASACVTYEDAAKVVALYREKLERRFNDENTQEDTAADAT